MARSKFYAKFEDSENLDETTLLEIEEFAAGMELDEISDFFGFDIAKEAKFESDDGDDVEAEFTSPVLCESEMKWVLKAFKRGRAAAKKKAVDHLFVSMKDRNGQNASLPYLQKFAKEWPAGEAGKLGDVLVFRANI